MHYRRSGSVYSDPGRIPGFAWNEAAIRKVAHFSLAHCPGSLWLIIWTQFKSIRLVSAPFELNADKFWTLTKQSCCFWEKLFYNHWLSTSESSSVKSNSIWVQWANFNLMSEHPTLNFGSDLQSTSWFWAFGLYPLGHVRKHLPALCYRAPSGSGGLPFELDHLRPENVY